MEYACTCKFWFGCMARHFNLHVTEGTWNVVTGIITSICRYFNVNNRYKLLLSLLLFVLIFISQTTSHYFALTSIDTFMQVYLIYYYVFNICRYVFIPFVLNRILQHLNMIDFLSNILLLFLIYTFTFTSVFHWLNCFFFSDYSSIGFFYTTKLRFQGDDRGVAFVYCAFVLINHRN